jgi:peptidoglycan/xylan/chitin deacetylase (PgdA/CDA1 family)
VPRNVYLTFDDGPVALTQGVLNVLREHRVSATFFVNLNKLSNNADLQRSILMRMKVEGHFIANHGWDHDPMTREGYKKAGTAAVKEDFVRNQQELTKLSKEFGTFQVARLPGDGRFQTDFVTMLTADLKIPHAGWNFEMAPNDQRGLQHISHQNWQGVIGVRATSANQPGDNSIILLHDTHWKQPALLGQAIAKLKESCTIRPFVPVPGGLSPTVTYIFK